MENLQFKIGNSSNLPEDRENGTFYVTNDDKKMYLNDIVFGDITNLETKERVSEIEEVTSKAINELNLSCGFNEKIEYNPKNNLTSGVTSLSEAIDLLADAKQDTLVSGTNIKTINGESILGTGNLTIENNIQDAPKDGNTYGRNEGEWVQIPGKISASENTGEIFNDYESNIANAEYSHTEGLNNKIELDGISSHVEGYYNHIYGNRSHAECGGLTNIYLTSEAGSIKYQLSSGWLYTSLPSEELVDYFKQPYIKIMNENNVEVDADIIDVKVEDGKLFLIFDKTLSESEAFDKRRFYVKRSIITSDISHIEGASNYTSGMLSHLEGMDNTVLASEAAHVEGELNFVNVKYSGSSPGRTLSNYAVHVEGAYNIALNPCEHVQGCYNVSHTGETDDKRTLHSIGFGTKGNRKNLQEVMWNGDHYMIGVGDYDGVDIENSKSVQEVISSMATKDNLEKKADVVTIQTVQGTTPTQELKPNIFYKFGEVTTLTITLYTETSNLFEEYMFEFTSGITPTVLNLSEDIKWIGSNFIEPKKTYQVSIVNNIAVMGGV